MNFPIFSPTSGSKFSKLSSNFDKSVDANLFNAVIIPIITYVFLICSS
jgi:hypothetical protein